MGAKLISVVVKALMSHGMISLITYCTHSYTKSSPVRRISSPHIISLLSIDPQRCLVAKKRVTL